MDIEEIKTLTDLMVDHDLSEIMIRDGDKRIVIRRGARGAIQQIITSSAGTPAQPDPTAAGQPAPAGDAAGAQEDPNLAKITSPMVGTYYAASDPDSPPFVNVGDSVNPDAVVCIIEAMKVFNEIKAEVSGTIESIDVQNGAPVEFGQVIMTVRVG